MRGCNRLFIQYYFDEFMWRHNNKISRHEAFNKIFADIIVVHDKFSIKFIESHVLQTNGPDIELGEICDDDKDEREAGNFETVDAESAIEFFFLFFNSNKCHK